MTTPGFSLRRLAAGGLTTIALCLGAGTASPAAAQPAKPTIVLVHGAFADASSWSGVIARLQSQHYKVVAKAMAAAQRPVALSVLTEPSGVPAWRTIPSWYQIAGADNAIGTKVERIMARRIKATTSEVAGASHVVMMSHPEATTRVILAAARGAD
jgi:pimeloyl-ACP methyl ester carboxylesterase